MKFLNYIFLFLPFIVIGQNQKIIVNDFNNDAYVDTLISFYEGGSGFGGTYITLVNGKTGERFEMNDFGCFCDIKQIILIPPVLLLPENQSFFDAMKDELLPDNKKVPDASLQWLLTSHENYRTITDNPYYDLVVKTPISWNKSEIAIPGNYYIDIKMDTMQKFIDTVMEIPKWYEAKSQLGYLLYYGQNHFSNYDSKGLELVATSTEYKVFKSFHGIVIEKNNAYAWVFVTDYRLTGGPEKMRWESIGSVNLIGDFLFVQLISSETFFDPIFIIDLKTGICARLKPASNEWFYSYSIDDNKLIVSYSQGKYTYELNKLISELKVVEWK